MQGLHWLKRELSWLLNLERLHRLHLLDRLLHVLNLDRLLGHGLHLLDWLLHILNLLRLLYACTSHHSQSAVGEGWL